MPYTGQYLPGKANTSYKSPALYIELPRDLQVRFYPNLRKAATGTIRIHYISPGPYQSHRPNAQALADAAHQAKLTQIGRLLTGYSPLDGQGRILCQQLIPGPHSAPIYQNNGIVSVIGFSAELYDYGLKNFV
jgi:hypothetical protein